MTTCNSTSVIYCAYWVKSSDQLVAIQYASNILTDIVQQLYLAQYVQFYGLHPFYIIPSGLELEWVVCRTSYHDWPWWYCACTVYTRVRLASYLTTCAYTTNSKLFTISLVLNTFTLWSNIHRSDWGGHSKPTRYSLCRSYNTDTWWEVSFAYLFLCNWKVGGVWERD